MNVQIPDTLDSEKAAAAVESYKSDEMGVREFQVAPGFYVYFDWSEDFGRDTYIVVVPEEVETDYFNPKGRYHYLTDTGDFGDDLATFFEDMTDRRRLEGIKDPGSNTVIYQ